MCRFEAHLSLDVMCCKHFCIKSVIFAKSNHLRIHKFANFAKTQKLFKFSGIKIEIKACIIFKNNFWTILKHENFMYNLSYACLIKNRNRMKNSNN